MTIATNNIQFTAGAQERLTAYATKPNDYSLDVYTTVIEVYDQQVRYTLTFHRQHVQRVEETDYIVHSLLDFLTQQDREDLTRHVLESANSYINGIRSQRAKQ